ncbi:hypothetical protein ACFC1R_32005 [Kitasatospora sp. NPDC056138]|uniref:hypothetical protein n=1 Tax=Kitasatospora sp. NPDC056138 TaxID=3345724 RepID=UPI0035D969C3
MPTSHRPTAVTAALAAVAAAAALLFCGAVLLATSSPAAAHGDSISLRISGRADGHPVVVASWENDGDPVTEPVAGTLSGVASDGRSVGPWRLTAVPGAEATYTTDRALPAGSWQVTVEAGFPSLGRGEASLTVTAVADPSAGAGPAAGASVRPPSAGPVAPTAPPAGTASPSAAGGSANPPSSHSGSGGWTTGIAIVVALLAIVILALVVRLRRRLAGRS